MNDDLKVENFALVVVVTELMFIFAVFLSFLVFKVNPANSIHFNLKALWLSIPITLLLTVINIIALDYFSRYIGFFKHLKEAYNLIVPMVSKITFPEIIIVSIVSGFAEELFFRGLIQPTFGIIFTSIIFGLFHIGNKKTVPYGLYSMGIGFFLGYLFHISNNLLLPMLVHIMNNFVAFIYMKYYYAKRLPTEESTGEIEGNGE